MKLFFILLTVIWASVLSAEPALTGVQISKFLKDNRQTGNEYQTMAEVEKFFVLKRQLTDKAVAVLKPYLQKETSEAWLYHIVLIKNPGFTMFGDLTVEKKTKKITQSDFMWKKYRIPASHEDEGMTLEQACQILLKTKLFGFGNKMGVKKPRDTDEAYRTILKAKEDKAIFLNIYDEGTIYTKLFALCALFHLNHKAYLERVAKLDKMQKLTCRFGCAYDEPTVGKIIDNIENSKYEYMYQRPNKFKRINKEKAKQLFSEYLKKNGKKPAEFDVHLRPFGKSTWFIMCFWKGIHPAMDWRHLITAQGVVKEINDDALNVLFMGEYPLSAYTEEEKEKTIKAFLGVYSGEAIDIIHKASDIPGHDKKPIDEDLAPAIRAPYINKDGITVVYTYQKIGGVVRRFRFHWTQDQRFRRAEAAKLAEGIGAADYYE